MVTSVEYPGTGVSVAAILIGAFIIGLSIRIFAFMFGFSVDVTGGTSAGKRIQEKEDRKTK